VWAKRLKIAGLVAGGAVFIFAAATIIALKPVTRSFDSIIAESRSTPVTDRHGLPLSVSYQSPWNTDNIRALYNMPALLVTSFVFSEDRKFYDHGGVDWRARAGALIQNIKRGETVRGASTITEQTVRLINVRPRNLWSKWLEGIEATLLERHASKPAILEFYLNQIPYAAGRRGVEQAARYYFNRDLDTLSSREIMALAILARAPSAYDLYKNPQRLEKPLERLVLQMQGTGTISQEIFSDINLQTLNPTPPSLPVEARHYVRFARLQSSRDVLHTALDSSLQNQVQDILDARIKKLSGKNVTNGGAIVIDHENGDILAWVVAGARSKDTKAGDIDTILTPRQPGSTLKPFLYAAALESGWTAASIINDAPVAEAVGSGLHRFRNYSGTYYGPVTLREALGNSLNIPAVLTINYVGVEKFLSDLHRLGFENLDRGSDFYDEGLALGNGEVSLYEMTRAYSTLANRGKTVALNTTYNQMPYKGTQIYSVETASIIGNILSDPRARALEFGSDSVLNLPVRTAAKTGTSTDYRDAWTLAYNDRYTVGIWMGNLDRTPMKDVTGSTGPALAMRSIFNVLNNNRATKPLYLAPTLVEADICTRPAKADGPCPMRTEYFAKAPAEETPVTAPPRKIELVRPTAGLRMALDPRIPKDHQKFRFELSGLADGEEAEWILNGTSIGRTTSPRYLWPVEKGTQELAVIIHGKDAAALPLKTVKFHVR